MITRNATLVIPAGCHERLKSHLFPGDGLEAAALLLCSPVRGRRLKLLVKDILTVPHSACRRTCDSISWPGEFVEAAIDRAEEEGLCIIAAHSHPQGWYDFSPTDNASDELLMPSLYAATGREHGSAIMIPGGQVKARIRRQDGQMEPIHLVICPGHDIALWWHEGSTTQGPPAPPMAFGSEMTGLLKRMSACVIGVSGTGSIIAEQLARLGFGEIILIDFDKIETRNLNRILNSTLKAADDELLKVEMFANAIRLYRSDCTVVPVPRSIMTRDAILAATDADVLLSCVDTAEGRHLADRIAAYFAMPLFDVGVSIPTRDVGDGTKAIADVCGRIDYVFPGGSTLFDRQVYDGKMLEAEYLMRTSPDAYRQKLKDGYLRGVAEQAPAVISLNMRASSVCAMEFIARSFPFRHFSNASRVRTLFMLADGDEEFYAEHEFVAASSFPVGAGATEPLLGMPLFSEERRAA